MAPMLSTFGSAASRNYGLQLPTGPAPSDADWDEVALLMKGQIARDGDDNITIDDESSSNHTVSTTGSLSQGSISPFRPDGYSVYFDGAGDEVRFADSANWHLGISNQAYTIECWVKYTTANGVISAFGGSGGSWSSGGLQWHLYWNSDDSGPRFDWYTGSGETTVGGGTYVLGKWHHVAVAYDGTNTSLFLDGTRVATSTAAYGNMSGTVDKLTIGRMGDGDWDLEGLISNLRIVKGSYVYDPTSSSVTVPDRKSLLTDITNTVLLTCMDNRFIDRSDTVALNSITGTPKIAHESPIGTATAWDPATHAGSYDIAASSYLSASASSDFDVAGGSFTIECWMFDEGHGSSNLSFFEYGAGGSWANVDYILYTNATTLSYDRFDGGSGNILQQGTIRLNEWHHVAVCFDGTNTSLFIDGTRVATDTTGQNLAGGTPVLYFGNGWDGTGWTGLLSGMRIVKGTDVYGATNSSITVPTAPFTAITNTKLLLNGTNAPIVDAKASVNLQMTGDTQSDTAITKFDLVSALQDGTADNITPVAPLDAKMIIGVADFCIEGWFYFDSVAATPRMVDFRPLSTNGLYPGIRLNGANVSYWNDSAEKIVGTTTVTTGAWHHIAVSRSGTSTKMWLAGSQEGSTYTDSSAYLVGANRPILGGAGHTISSNIMDGNYEGLRITIGAARYTTGFTPPAAVFPPNGSS